MSSTPSTAPPKRARSSRATKTQTAEPLRSAPVLSAEQRRSLIAERAYLRAEGRGFEGGDPIIDWLESEREVDALLSQDAD
jgi:Protein of unknown function (DUF2934)